jgi:4-hydroxybenzoate polyprenyltransferase
MRDWIRLLRPHQWIKSSFVLVGFLFGRRWNDAALAADVGWMVVAFCLAASAVYALNDVVDRDADRAHPVKRNRPVASGAIGVSTALIIGALLLIAALAIAAYVSTAGLACIAAYAVINLVYSLGAKHVAVLDVFMIASGFMLRILAGTIGVGIEPSQWLLLCGLMITLFLGFVKRRAETLVLAEGSSAHRPALQDYTPALLDNMITVSAAGVIVTYSLYTVSPDTIRVHGTDRLVLSLPFVLYAMFRYLFLLHARGGGGDPSRDLLSDAQLVIAALGWIAVTMYLVRGSLFSA